MSDNGVFGQAVVGATRLYRVPPASVVALLVAGLILGVVGDGLLRVETGPVHLNMSLWVASVAVAVLVLHRRAALALDRERIAWLVIGVLCAAGLAWRDAPPLKLLALACATLSFALAAHRLAGGWVRRSGVLRYGGALALGALHAWTAPVLALVDVTRSTPRAGTTRAARWRNAAAIARGLAIAAPLIVVFGALFMSADAVFAELAGSVVRFDVELIASHVLVFAILGWISTGYLRGFLTTTDLPLADRRNGIDGQGSPAPTWLALGITEVATALAAIDLLFLVFVIVQFRYLFGADTLVQVTPDLTYADYARRGFFELVFAVVLVVPVLLAADWLLDRRAARDAVVFRALAGLQIGLVLAIAASALQRLRLYDESYGLTESRLYAMVLLIWIGAMLVWLAATVLRGRRDSFAFGTLASGLATVALLFVINPDAVVVRANVARTTSADAPVPFDAAYAARSESADAVPLLIDALARLPPDVQCPIARNVLRRWPPDRAPSIRSWSWSAARASAAVREHEARLRSMVALDPECAAPR